jgi:hypothetical protein
MMPAVFVDLDMCAIDKLERRIAPTEISTFVPFIASTQRRKQDSNSQEQSFHA